MAVSRAQPPSGSEGQHLVLYDGVCALCNGLVQFLLRYDHQRVFNFTSLQSAIGQAMVGRAGGNPRDLTTFYAVADYRTTRPRVLTRSDAALFVVGELGWPWRAALLTKVVPKAIRDRVYDLVARTRYRVFGRYDQCLVPRPEFRSRFVE